jgi:hypothetical protein
MIRKFHLEAHQLFLTLSGVQKKKFLFSMAREWNWIYGGGVSELLLLLLLLFYPVVGMADCN